MDDKEMNDLFEKLRSDVLPNKEENISKTQIEDKEILDKGKNSPLQESTGNITANGKKGNENNGKEVERFSVHATELLMEKCKDIKLEADNDCEELAPDTVNDTTSPTPLASPSFVASPLTPLHKQIKINVKRTNLTDYKKLPENRNSIDEDFKKPNTPVKRKSSSISPVTSKQKLETNKPLVFNASNTTPTKAQQKLFDSKFLVKNALFKQYNCKGLKVKLKKTDLQILQKQTLNENKKNRRISPPKRKSNTPTPDSSPVKKTRKSVNEKDVKSNFFIKLTPKVESNKDSSTTPKQLSSGKSPMPSKSPKNQKPKSPVKKMVTNEKAQKENFKLTVKPTKFSKTFLEKTFGKRFFQLVVKMEKFEHPILVEFEAKANAAKREARDKKKNLSVSFKDQVEIFGLSDSESENELIAAATSKQAVNKTTHMPITPSKLIKTENGKVIDTIDLDSTIFLDPKEAVASTPLRLPSRKKHEKKCFSPLKDEGLTSPRKEQLKLADEKLPPKDLRCLGTGEGEDDEEDVEYIVPFEVPQRTTAKTTTDTEAVDAVQPVDTEIPNNNENKENENKENKKKVEEAETLKKNSPNEIISNDNDIKLDSSGESFATADNVSDNEGLSSAKSNDVEAVSLKTCDTAECNKNKTTNVVQEQKLIADDRQENNIDSNTQLDKCSEESAMMLRMEDSVTEKHQESEAYSEDDNKDSEKVSNDDSTETHPPERDSAADPETDDEDLKNSQITADNFGTTTTQLLGATNSKK